MSLRSACVAGAVALLSALCAGCPSLDSGGTSQRSQHEPDGTGHEPPTEAELELLGSDQHTLKFGEEAALDVRYTMPDGAPIDGGLVSFALIGTANGSSLQALDVTTDESGMARNVLLAGNQAGSFQVRVAAEGAEPLFVNVAVSDRGFGTVIVLANYVGNRFVARRTVVAQAEASCSSAERQPGDPMQTLTELGPVRFVALPAGRHYAFSVFAEGPDALSMASGCADGVMVEADQEVTVSVDFVDEPLSIDGHFSSRLEMDSAAPAAVLGEAIRQAGRAFVESDADGNSAPIDAEGRYLFDVLDQALRSEQYASNTDLLALADALSAERLAPTLVPALEAQLQTRLDAAAVGALVALETLAATSEQSLQQTVLQSVWMLTLANGTLTAEWQPGTWSALPVGSAPTAPGLDLSSTGQVAMNVELMPEADRVQVQSAHLPLGWGALGAQSLGVAAGADSGLLDRLHDELGCGELDALLGTLAWAQDRCDASCIATVCARALGAIVAGAEGALLALDVARPDTVLAGTLLLRDKDGDLRAESLSSAFDGQWQDAADAGQALSAMGSGTLEAPQLPADLP